MLERNPLKQKYKQVILERNPCATKAETHHSLILEPNPLRPNHKQVSLKPNPLRQTHKQVGLERCLCHLGAIGFLGPRVSLKGPKPLKDKISTYLKRDGAKYPFLDYNIQSKRRF